MRCFTLNTVTYGTSSVSFLATRVLKQLAEEHQNEHPKVCDVIRNNFYMDDLLTGTETIEELLNMKHDISWVLQQGGFNLRKWLSNEPLLLDSNQGCVVPFGKDVIQSTVGVIWNSTSDTLQYTIGKFESSNSITKRSILFLASKIFDPLGLLAPITLLAKLIM